MTKADHFAGSTSYLDGCDRAFKKLEVKNSKWVQSSISKAKIDAPKRLRESQKVLDSAELLILSSVLHEWEELI